MMNMNQLMKQAQNMQKKMQEMQEALESKEYQGSSGGGLVNVTLSGKGLLLRVSIDESLMTPDEKEMMEDLIVAAFNDAKQKVDSEAQGSMQSAFGNLGLPPGFKMPF